jgi:hypothetical protein
MEAEANLLIPAWVVEISHMTVEEKQNALAAGYDECESVPLSLIWVRNKLNQIADFRAIPVVANPLGVMYAMKQ